MKILIVQTSFLGDVILSTPVISAVKELYPEAELSFMLRPQARDLVCRDPLLAEVIPFDKNGRDSGLLGLFRVAKEIKTRNFDMAFALQRSIHTSLLLKLAGIKKVIGYSHAPFAKLFYSSVRKRVTGLHSVLRTLAIVVDDVDKLDEREVNLRLFAPQFSELAPSTQELLQGKSDWIVMAPGSAWPTKRWSQAGFREVFSRLRKENKTVFVTGSPAERSWIEDITGDEDEFNLAGRLSLSDSMYLFQHAKALICNDSMSLHLGSAFKIPTVVIFCATSPSFGFGPWNNRAVVLEKNELSCRPCARHGSKKCPNGTYACIEGISADDVLQALREVASLSS